MGKQLFEVDKEGLARIAERRGKAFILYELVQNGWDAKGVTRVSVKLEPVPGRPYAIITIEDDSPDGFRNLAHAWTLFAESEKKSEPTLRGRFNLGEKLVIACCCWAEIVTTTGGVRFDSDGRHTLRRKRESGSVFLGEVRMTREEYEEVCQAAEKILPPENIETTFNGVAIVPRLVKGLERLMLPTEIPDEDGYLRRKERRSEIRIYEPREGETSMLYELGIPVMELDGDKYHVDVAQKVPLTLERDGVHPSYLRKVRTAVLNTMAYEVTKEDAGSAWVKDALSSPDVDKQAVETVLTAAFGRLRVTYDPSDPEANNRAMAAGYTVIPSAALPGEAWSNVRRFESSKPAGQVTPGPKAFSLDGDPLKTVDPKDWTHGMKRVGGYAIEMGSRILKKNVSMVVANDAKWPHAGAFGPDGVLFINLFRVGHRWFNGEEGMERVDRLLIHEFAHFFAANHLSDDFHTACCRVGAAMKALALAEPDLCKVW